MIRQRNSPAFSGHTVLSGCVRLTGWVMVLTMGWTWTPYAAATSVPGDGDIKKFIDRYLAIETTVVPGSIDIDVKDGIVMLSGSVSNLLQRNQVKRVTGSVVGVRSVVDNIRVEPAVRDDKAIARDVLAILPPLPPDRKAVIGVNVKNGVVTLNGRVDSWVLSRLADRRAMSVKGVSRIVNQIDVSPGTHRDDQLIRADVERRLAADLYVDASSIEVAVNNGRVSLAGTVRTLAQKHRSVDDAWIAGVVEVDDRKLSVDWRTAIPTLRSSPYVHQPDETISRAVRDALRLDPRMTSPIPEVSVVNGAVTLSGVVETLYAKQAAEADALNTTGVWRVINRLQLRYRDFPPDKAVEQLIRDVFRRDAELDGLDINVAVVDHHLTLTGNVENMSQKIRAVNIASRIDGVLAVDDRIQVASSAQTASDSDMHAAITDELYWSPYVDSDPIHVIVTDGQAVLTGRAVNRFVARMAVINAFEGGARSVRTRLKLKNGGTYAEHLMQKPADPLLDTGLWP